MMPIRIVTGAREWREKVFLDLLSTFEVRERERQQRLQVHRLRC